MKQVPAESVADAYLEILAARGVDYFFGNGGTDFAPIIDAFAKRMALEQPIPKPVTVPHETTAVAMAHGYTMITRRPQVVMVHTTPGTANATANLINASRQLVPMLFSAGRTPISETGPVGARNLNIHWAQESFDQGSMVREWVKWDYELRADADLEAVVDRAMAIAESEPQGPVYLTLPREVIAREIESIAYAERRRMQPNATAPVPESVRAAARALAAAKQPIAIAKAVGRVPEAVPLLVELAELLNMPVFEFAPNYMNFPVGHRLHAGGDPGPHLAEADVVVVLEADVPWMPSSGQEPREDATVIALGEDPLFADYPNRGFRVDVNLGGSPRAAIAALTAALRAETLDAERIAARGARWAEEHERVRHAARERAEATRDRTPIDKAWGSYCAEQVRDDDTIIINELGFDTGQMEFSTPGTFFGTSAAGSLGWAHGAALGAKLAARDKTVIACMGDGSYMFGAPEAGHWVSRRMQLPVLYVVWNDSQWGAVANATRRVHPDGWAVRTGNFPFSDLGANLDFEMICQAAGGYGEKVEDPAELPGAFERALRVVKEEGRQALLNVVGGSR